MNDAPLNLREVEAQLDEVRAAVDHGEAAHNPQALSALRAADGLLVEVARLRIAVRSIVHSAAEEYRQALTAARDIPDPEAYAKNDGAAEMARVIATNSAQAAGLPVPDWEAIRRDIPDYRGPGGRR